jgi:hypothetical protein
VRLKGAFLSSVVLVGSMTYGAVCLLKVWWRVGAECSWQLERLARCNVFLRGDRIEKGGLETGTKLD